MPNAQIMQNSAIASINPLCQCREMTDFGNNCELRPTFSAAAQFLDPLIIRPVGNAQLPDQVSGN